jgi:hypothetical protein
MAVSPYFRHVTAKNEQKLIDDLTRETYYQRGLDFWYVPRINSDTGFDYLFGEDPENIFKEAVLMEFYLENVSTGFDGEMSIGRFALELGDTATITCSRTRFTEEVTKRYTEIVRPREGDLIILKYDPSEPMDVFEIVFTEKETPFYQIGKSNVYRMEVERFAYSHEDLETGIDTIDDVPMDDDKEYSDSEPMQTESDELVDFSENDPFSDGEY